MARSALLLLGVLCASMLTLSIVSAQEATPAATPPAGLTFPDPSECDVEPKPLSYFEELIATPPTPPPNPDEIFWSPTAEPRPWTLPEGEPADDATAEAAVMTMHEAVACLNANDVLRFLNMFSDDMLHLFFALEPLPPEALASFEATPVASPPDQWLGYGEILDVRVLPDGRVSILANNWDPTQPPFGMGVDFAILEKVGDRWVIDSLIENVVIVEDGTPVAGTPAA